MGFALLEYEVDLLQFRAESPNWNSAASWKIP